ncbi:MAG: acyloxyacyl hydrolase [Janthinobacterium lividum]
MTFSRFGQVLTAAALSLGALSPAVAADLPARTAPLPTFIAPAPVVSSPYGILSEVRFGVLAHGVDEHEFGTVDVNGEILTVKPTHLQGAWDYLIPRFHLGGNVNTSGRTSDVYGGVTWQFPIYNRFFGELGFGGDLNDGNTSKVFPKFGNNDIRVGCVANFRESASLGYHLDEHWNVMAFAEHASNAGLCAHNEGITAMGARVGYAF